MRVAVYGINHSVATGIVTRNKKKAAVLLGKWTKALKIINCTTYCNGCNIIIIDNIDIHAACI